MSATFCSCSMASRPLSGAAARRVWRPRLRARAAFRSAASCSHSTRHRRRERRLRDLLCAAELALASASASATDTDDAHHRRGVCVFIIKHFRFAVNRSQITTMFSFIVFSCFTLVSAQLQHLQLSQHTALMDVYDALGSNGQTTRNTRVANEKNRFCSSGCSPSLCPRFAATAPCNGSRLTCSEGNVTYL
jgi:hypothetical protein